jgi:hypothetical protein
MKTLQANEFRYGNLVNDNYQVVEIDSSVLGLTDMYNEDDTASYVYFEFASIKPIPLTEQWLLDFGFELKFDDEDDNSIYVLNEFEITKDCFKEDFWLDAKIITPDRIETVHQLQNLFHSLTNEELKLNKQ